MDDKSKKYLMNKQVYRKSKKERLSNWMISILFILITLYVIGITLFGIRFVTVSGNSMAPNLDDTEKIVMYKPFWSKEDNLKRGSVVVFDAHKSDPRAHSDEYVKRIIGVPGDRIVFDSKRILINGMPESDVIPGLKTDESSSKVYTSNGDDLDSWSLGSLSTRQTVDGKSFWNTNSVGHERVPEGMYFVMGDHRKVSNDSRYFGYVPASAIIGVVKE